jgi:hypothetical protein
MAKVYIVTEYIFGRQELRKVFSTYSKADDYLRRLTKLNRHDHTIEMWDVD